MPNFQIFTEPKKIIEYPSGRFLSETDLPQRKPQERNYGIPESQLKTEIEGMKNRSPEDIYKAIDLAPEITDKEGARGFLDTLIPQAEARSSFNPAKQTEDYNRLTEFGKEIQKAPKTLWGLAKSLIIKHITQEKIVSELNSRIGPESVVGLKNMSINAKRIREYVKKGDIEGAMDYVGRQIMGIKGP